MKKSDYKDMWVYVEHDGQTVRRVTLELLCEIRKLCDTTGEKLYAVMAGTLPDGELERLRGCGTDGIIRVTGTGYEQYNAEAWTNMFTVLCEKYHPSAVFVGATDDGRDFAPRFALRLGTGCTSDAIRLEYDAATGDIEFIEPAVGGKIMAVITVPVLRPQVGTIRPGTFRYEPAGARPDFEVRDEHIDFPEAAVRFRRIDFHADAADPELDIATADVIVCVGNGLKGADRLPRYRELAKLLGGKLACTRPLYDRDILPYRLQVGQSGVSVKPKLYLGFGISGAVNHVSGVAAGTFVAVNTDPEAQIFNYCDYGIVGDMDEVCDAMLAALRARGQ